MHRGRLSTILVALASLAACSSPGGGGETPQGSDPTSTTFVPPDVSQAPSPSASATPGPPPVEAECKRDDECAVARVSVSGKDACCSACATTPGTRRWHAKLQRFCASNPPASCPPLGCPMGPTRAICNAGKCEATPSGPDGKPVFVMSEQKCLPAMVCDEWAGCVLLTGNTQDGWFVQEKARVPVGEIAGVDNVCTTTRCEGARLFPEGPVCPPHTIPPMIDPPPYSCVMEGGHCVKKPK